jgi:hypothetical protein
MKLVVTQTIWRGLVAPRLVTWLTLMVSMGCTGATAIEGVVYTKPGIAESYLLGGIDTDNAYQPVSGARIYLSFDKDGKTPLKGFETVSHRDGRYKLAVKDLPRSPTRYGNDYYLVVEQKGFQRLAIRITTGPLAASSVNTVILAVSRE